MIKRIVKKSLRAVGIELRKASPLDLPFLWLKKYNIQTVLDVGANTGQFAHEIREALPHAQILSFEPIKECYDTLTSSFVHDRFFKAYHTALGTETGSSLMNKSSYTPSSSLLPMAEVHKQHFPHTKDHTTESVKVSRLDDIAQELSLRPEILIKMDVQGYEDKVIDGGIETLKKCKVAIIENSFSAFYTNQPLFDDIYKKMTGAGFSYRSSIHQKKDKKTGEILFEDSVFIK